VYAKKTTQSTIYLCLSTTQLMRWGSNGGHRGARILNGEAVAPFRTATVAEL